MKIEKFIKGGKKCFFNNLSSKKKDDIKELNDSYISKSQEIGYDVIPLSTSEINLKIISMFDNSQKIMTPKMVYNILHIKTPKYFSDKLWNMYKSGLIKFTGSRGYYCSINKEL